MMLDVSAEVVIILQRDVFQPMHRPCGYVPGIQDAQSPTRFRGTTVLQAAIQYRVDVRDDRVARAD